MTLYIDISEFLKTRLTTGIQRVIKEFLKRAILDNYRTNILYYDNTLKTYQLLDNSEFGNFLKDIKNYNFKHKQEINLFQSSKECKIFFDIDSVWNTDIKRVQLYPELKSFNYKIVNFIYDLIPILYPDYLHKKTKKNFPNFLDAVFTYSDIVFFDSISSQNDFLNLKNDSKIIRDIKTDIIYLGADFLQKISKTNHKYSSLLSKKYLLFVGTIEPRKKQVQVLKAFEVLQKAYPELHLVFIGRVGWNVELFMDYLNTHPLKDKNIHHLYNIDDNTLNLFYKNAFIVTYISDYEGYGLPIAESLSHSNITITSKNSSMYEVGQDFADYLFHNTEDEIVTMVSSYLQNPKTYKKKKEYIKNHYKTPSWDDFYKQIVEKLSYESKK